MPTRRQFALSLCAALAPPPPEIIDTHTHFYDPSRPQGLPWPPPNDPILYRTVLPDEFVELTRPLGVTGTIVVEASAWVEDNAWILELARRHPVIRGLVGRLEPGTPAFARQIDRFRKDTLFLGIRVGGAALAESVRRPAFLDDMRRLAAAGLALDLVGGGSIIEAAARLHDAIPSLRIVLDHLPFDQATDLVAMKGRREVFAKVSNFWNEPRWSESAYLVFQSFGEDRIIFGSNWPVSLRQASYPGLLDRARGFIRPHGPAAERKYFHENARLAYRFR